MTALDPLAALLPEEEPPPPPTLLEATVNAHELLGGAQPWRHDAACGGQDPALWFPSKGQSSRPALEVCTECPVMEECREDILTWEARWGFEFIHGVRGGLTAVDRRAIYSNRLKEHEGAGR